MQSFYIYLAIIALATAVSSRKIFSLSETVDQNNLSEVFLEKLMESNSKDLKDAVEYLNQLEQLSSSDKPPHSTSSKPQHSTTLKPNSSPKPSHSTTPKLNSSLKPSHSTPPKLSSSCPTCTILPKPTASENPIDFNN